MKDEPKSWTLTTQAANGAVHKVPIEGGYIAITRGKPSGCPILRAGERPHILYAIEKVTPIVDVAGTLRAGVTKWNAIWGGTLTKAAREAYLAAQPGEIWRHRNKPFRKLLPKEIDAILAGDPWFQLRF